MELAAGGYRRPATAWALAGLVLLLTRRADTAVADGPGRTQLATRSPRSRLPCRSRRWAWSWPGTGRRNPIGWLMLWPQPWAFMLYDGSRPVRRDRLPARSPAPARPGGAVPVSRQPSPSSGCFRWSSCCSRTGGCRLPRWRWVVRGYLALAVADMIVQGQMSVYALTHHRTQVDASGQLVALQRLVFGCLRSGRPSSSSGSGRSRSATRW